MIMMQANRRPSAARSATGAVARQKRGLPMHVREVDSVEGLAIIRRPGSTSRSGQGRFRQRSWPTFQQWSRPVLRRCDAKRPHDAIEAELRTLLPPSPFRDWLAADAALLARTLAQLTGTRRVVLRIEAIVGDACRLFHADAVALRLVTTYEGRGTQWLSEADVDISDHGGDVPEDRIYEMATGTVGVFKGLRGVTGKHPLIHRSPPRRPGDPVRLFLAVDPATH